MIERDYLMRQLMQLLEALQKIILFRKRGEVEQAKDEIDFFYRCLKIEDDFQKLSIEEVIRKLTEDKKFTNEQIEMIAFVLKEQGEMAVEEEDRKDYFLKSLFLLQRVDRESITYSMDRQMKIGEIREYLS
jgi:hypothetical protein